MPLSRNLMFLLLRPFLKTQHQHVTKYGTQSTKLIGRGYYGSVRLYVEFVKNDLGNFAVAPVSAEKLKVVKKIKPPPAYVERNKLWLSQQQLTTLSL